MTQTRRNIAYPRTRCWEYSSKDGVTVSSYGAPGEFCRSFLSILAETRTNYRQLFGDHTIGHVEFNIRKSRRLPLRLWTNGADRIVLTLSRKDQLQPAQSGGIRHLHGLTHELAHIVMHRSLINLSRLKEGWGEGWAVYWGSFWAVPHLFTLLGEAAWPYPYNYLKTDGPTWYAERIADRNWCPANSIQRVVRDLMRWHQYVGSDAFVEFFSSILNPPITAERFNVLVGKELKKFQNKQTV